MKLGRLSLPAVGVMISLSNLFSTNKKVISIKKIVDIFEEKKQEEQSPLQDGTSIKLRIDQLRLKLQKLETEKEKILEDLQRAIAKEKAAWEEQKAIEKKEAQNVGYKVGYDAGYEDVFKEYEALIVEANNFTARAKADYDKTISKYD